MTRKLERMPDIFVPVSRNLSIAWAELFLKLMQSGIEEISPAVIIVDDFDDAGRAREDSSVRELLDECLLSVCGRQRIHTCQDVADTIFPESLWNPQRTDQDALLFSRFMSIWPRLQARDRQNRRGNYFQRLIDFKPIDYPDTVNQLSKIIEAYQSGNHRRSALQATLFDATRDHLNTRMLGFPCLQQVAFGPTADGLVVSAYYATQYVFERAYGNYLGLCRLGRFMARQFDMPLKRMVCFVSVAKRGNQTKRDLRALEEELQNMIHEREAAQSGKL